MEQHVHERPSPHDYVNASCATTISVARLTIGDVVETGELGRGYQVVLTVAMRPYSNALFATREGAINYMRLVAAAHVIGAMRKELDEDA